MAIGKPVVLPPNTEIISRVDLNSWAEEKIFPLFSGASGSKAYKGVLGITNTLWIMLL